MLLMSQAPTLLTLSIYYDAVPCQYLHALASLRSPTRLTVGTQLHRFKCSDVTMQPQRISEGLPAMGQPNFGCGLTISIMHPRYVTPMDATAATACSPFRPWQ